MINLFTILFSIVSVYAAGEFSVLHHPSSLVFKGHDILKESTLTDVYAASLGFSTEHFSNWGGLYIDNPFEVAQAIITIYIDGVTDIGQQKGHHFPLKTDVNEIKVYKSLEDRIIEHYPDQKTNLVRIRLSNGLEEVRKYPVFQDVPSENPKHVSHKALKLTVDEDQKFLKEITLLHEIAEKIEQNTVEKDFIPDVFWFEVSALHAFSDLYGENSTEVIEAHRLLNEVILRLNAAFTKVYDGFVVINVITSDASHTRKGRSLQANADSDDKKPTTDKEKYNLASYYGKEYPAIFNIILWFGVVMLFSLIAICLAIGNMDPGRDSIIYRMTSTRMKKDN